MRSGSFNEDSKRAKSSLGRAASLVPHGPATGRAVSGRRFATIGDTLSNASSNSVSPAVEVLHGVALAAAALGLLVGLFSGRASLVNPAISLMLLLPPLRLATTVVGEATAKRYATAAMGFVVLAFLLVSRRIS